LKSGASPGVEFLASFIHGTFRIERAVLLLQLGRLCEVGKKKVTCTIIIVSVQNVAKAKRSKHKHHGLLLIPSPMSARPVVGRLLDNESAIAMGK